MSCCGGCAGGTGCDTGCGYGYGSYGGVGCAPGPYPYAGGGGSLSPDLLLLLLALQSRGQPQSAMGAGTGALPPGVALQLPVLSFPNAANAAVQTAPPPAVLASEGTVPGNSPIEMEPSGFRSGLRALGAWYQTLGGNVPRQPAYVAVPRTPLSSANLLSNYSEMTQWDIVWVADPLSVWTNKFRQPIPPQGYAHVVVDMCRIDASPYRSSRQRIVNGAVVQAPCTSGPDFGNHGWIRASDLRFIDGSPLLAGQHVTGPASVRNAPRGVPSTGASLADMMPGRVRAVLNAAVDSGVLTAERVALAVSELEQAGMTSAANTVRQLASAIFPASTSPSTSPSTGRSRAAAQRPRPGQFRGPSPSPAGGRTTTMVTRTGRVITATGCKSCGG